MLFRTQPSGVLAISQLAHAWLSGQILRAWEAPLSEPLLLAAEQHDIGWMDWETAPTFDARTGRPHLFRDVGASLHAPMWSFGVRRAHEAWGAHVALLVSRHGGVIYRRYTDRHKVAPADAAAADLYLATQAPVEAAWARRLGLDEGALRVESALVALVDALSLALCGELKTPLEFEAPGRDGGSVKVRLTEKPGQPFDFILTPWPFRVDAIAIEGEARPLPPEGRFADEAAMRTWFAAPERAMFRARLMRA
ncbi:DUF3891 family protein [Methylocapsa sp. S129]|uniref:DUF3891 family protein n=1 Tax=Methylocapsa sp. S129 TaxID=1641869 RepID=UPI00131ABA73|nr:DUF3891 family protein [Methylocapsa sp. S129]